LVFDDCLYEESLEKEETLYLDELLQLVVVVVEIEKKLEVMVEVVDEATMFILMVLV